jgi:Kef-type K+ transport system membrane component KefB
VIQLSALALTAPCLTALGLTALALTAKDLTTMFFALAVLLGAAKLAGELVQKIGQPSILGEISAGILLGPTVLGHFRPEWYATLFPSSGPVPIVLETVATLGVVFFLLAAGLETSLHSIFRQGRSALFVSFFGVVFPFATGFLAAELFPHFLGAEPGSNRLVFALFVGTALSISALPVIAKILMDLGLLQTELGAVVMSSAMFDDLVGWILFGVVLGMVNGSTIGGSMVSGKMTGANTGGVLRTIILVGLFVVVTLTSGRWLIAKTLRFIQSHTTGRGAILGFIFTLTLAAAGFAEYAGIHAIFGAFIVAIAIGDSLGAPSLSFPTLERQGGDSLAGISTDIRQIATNVFAPFFFASIGLRTNFAANFSLGVTLTLIAVAWLGKILGASWGARLGGMDARSAWAVGFAMNVRGAMEIILGVLALRAGLIGERMFVALVVMALFTSLISGPAIQAVMRRLSFVVNVDFS